MQKVDWWKNQTAYKPNERENTQNYKILIE